MAGREDGRYPTCGDDCKEAARTEIVAYGNKFSSKNILQEI